MFGKNLCHVHQFLNLRFPETEKILGHLYSRPSNQEQTSLSPERPSHRKVFCCCVVPHSPTLDSLKALL